MAAVPSGRCRRRPGRALDFVGRPMKPAQLLAKRFNLSFVRRFLALRFLEQLQQFIHLVDGFAESRKHDHDLIDGQLDGFGRGGLQRTRASRNRRWLRKGVERGLNRSDQWLRTLHLRRRRKKRLVITARRSLAFRSRDRFCAFPRMNWFFLRVHGRPFCLLLRLAGRNGCRRARWSVSPSASSASPSGATTA
jgi:hypothetical protein